MKKRYFRAGFYPTGHKDEDMLWLDFTSRDMESAIAKAHSWARRHEGYDVLIVRGLRREHGHKHPREEPAEDGPENDLDSALLVAEGAR